MQNTFRVILVIVLLTIVGCSNSMNENDEEPTNINTISFHFIGEIIEMYDNTAIVNDSRGKYLVNLSVNKDEIFQVGDKVKVGYDGTIMESSPAQINTLSVELVDE